MTIPATCVCPPSSRQVWLNERTGQTLCRACRGIFEGTPAASSPPSAVAPPTSSRCPRPTDAAPIFRPKGDPTKPDRLAEVARYVGGGVSRVPGSNGEMYSVTRVNGILCCNCAAGQEGRPCSHVSAVRIRRQKHAVRITPAPAPAPQPRMTEDEIFAAFELY